MKRSQYGRIINLVKNAVEGEMLFYGSEITLEHEPPKQPEPKGNKEPMTLDEYRKKIQNCKKCPLGATRIKFVFGVGNPKAELMFVGEGPGFDEDHKGEPFIGRAGQLLTKIIESIGFKREDVYIANTVKCHPMLNPSDPESRGNDRAPTVEEIQVCLPYLEKQIELINPKFIVALGTWAARTLTASELPIGKLRGKFYDYKKSKLLPTYHPAALLRNPNFKKDVWQDMKMLMAEMGRKIPKTQNAE